MYDNVTTNESMGYHGRIQRRKPCCGISAMEQKRCKVNPYDMLWPNNMAQVMGSNFLMWPIPFWQPEMAGWGMYFPKLPALSPQDVGLL